MDSEGGLDDFYREQLHKRTNVFFHQHILLLPGTYMNALTPIVSLSLIVPSLHCVPVLLCFRGQGPNIEFLLPRRRRLSKATRAWGNNSEGWMTCFVFYVEQNRQLSFLAEREEEKERERASGAGEECRSNEERNKRNAERDKDQCCSSQFTFATVA